MHKTIYKSGSLGPILLLVVLIVANWVEDGRVERDIGARVAATISADDRIEEATSKVAGRDVSLKGISATSEVADTLARKVATLRGVRLVHSSFGRPASVVPYVLTALRVGGDVVLAGSAPSRIVEREIVAAAADGGRHVADRLTIAGGAPAGNYANVAHAALAALSKVDGRIVITGAHVDVHGTLRPGEERQPFEDSLRASLPAPFTLEILDLRPPAMTARASDRKPEDFASKEVASSNPRDATPRPPPGASRPATAFDGDRNANAHVDRENASGTIASVAPHPFTLEIGERSVRLAGDAPDDATRRQIEATAKKRFFDAEIRNDLLLSAGAPKDLAVAVTGAIPALARLGRGSLTIAGNKVDIAGGEAAFPAAAGEIRSALVVALGPNNTVHGGIGVARTTPLDAAACQPVFAHLLDVGRIEYAIDSAVLPDDATPLLDKLVLVAGRCRSASLIVSGYTDATGTQEHNLDLSRRRAWSVVAYLANAGVDTARITAVGHGENSPVASNATPDGRAENRHIEFKVLERRWRLGGNSR